MARQRSPAQCEIPATLVFHFASALSAASVRVVAEAAMPTPQNIGREPAEPARRLGGWKCFALSRQRVGLALVLAPLLGCQGVTGMANTSQVRIIDVSGYGAGLDIYQGSAVFAYNLGFGSVTSYVPIAPGTYSINADTAGTRSQMVTATGAFSPNSQFTALITDDSVAVRATILKDQSTFSPAGQVNMRFLNQVVPASAVDVYLVPSGSTIVNVAPLLTGFPSGKNSGYLGVAPGVYTMIILPTGTVPTTAATTLYTGAAVTYISGAARTFVYASPPDASNTIQVVTANDFDPPGSAV